MSILRVAAPRLIQRLAALSPLGLARHSSSSSSSFDGNWTSLTKSQLQAHVSSLPQHLRDELKKEAETNLKRATMQEAVVSGKNDSFLGRGKLMATEYGLPFVVYWWGLWIATMPLCIGGLEFFEIDGLALIQGFDNICGDYIGVDTDMASKINTEYGRIATGLVLNECLEVVRLPFIIATTPTFARVFFKHKKYE